MALNEHFIPILSTPPPSTAPYRFICFGYAILCGGVAVVDAWHFFCYRVIFPRGEKVLTIVVELA